MSLGFFQANKKKWIKTDLDSVRREIAKVDKDNQRLEYNGPETS